VGLREYQREPKKLASLVPWDTMLTPSIVQLKGGHLLQTMQLRGPDLDSSLDSALVVQAAKLNALFKRFSSGWALWSEARRREVRSYPEAQWPDPVSARVDAERRALFTAPRQHYDTQAYLALVCKKPPARTQRFQGWLWAHVPATAETETDLLTDFTDECTRTLQALQGCCQEASVLEGEALLAYLKSTVSTKEHRVRVPEPAHYLDSYLTDQDFHGGIYPSLGPEDHPDAYLRCLGIKARGYPEATYPGIWDVLTTLPMELRAVVRYLPLDRDAADQYLNTARKSHYGQRKRGSAVIAERFGQQATALVETAALDYAAEAAEAQAEVRKGRVSMGYCTSTVVVWDADLHTVTHKVEAVEQALASAGFSAKVETLNAVEAWRGTIPGCLTANVRRPLLHSMNLAHLFPATAPWRGVSWNTHLDGPPLMQVTGKGHTPFRLSLHDGDVGHTLIAGPTGAGKSTLLALIALQFLRYPDAQVYAWDKGQSLRCATYAVGGQWYDVAEEIGALFQAGRHLDDQDTQPWDTTWIPPYGRWQCFEMEELLHTPALVPGVLSALFRAIEGRLTGAPTLLLLDEAWMYLDAPLFAARIREWLKTMRKKNASVIFSTQSLADASQSVIAAAVNESCMTRLFLPNYRAMEPEIGALYDAYGLNLRQRELIATATPKRHYYYQGREGHQLFELQLGPITLALTGASRPPDLARIKDLYHKDPQRFAAAWLTEQGLSL